MSKKLKNKEDKEPLQEAKEYAFFLLKYRPRTEKEICARLKRKNFEAGVIKTVLDFLKNRNFIDDESFARIWVESRIKKPLGLRRLKEELRVKGINKEIIERALNEIKKGYDEEETINVLISQKLEKSKGLDPEKAKRRIYAYLLRRGFSPEAVITAVSQLRIKS
ncbi:MAG: regulatory protein RecX [Candidatus Omnitrophica bacterium]|nr:regulatory protein RecX [Candidatus Omnitrophota bacterium]